MIVLLCIILASCLNVLMDNMEPYRIEGTKLPQSWNKKYQGKKVKGTGYKMNPWHYCKSAMLCFIMAPICLDHKLIFQPHITALSHTFYYLDFILIGVVWCVVFGLGYKLLKR